MVQRDDIRDIDLSIRFKHGNHTIFLFVDPLQPFSEVQEELLEIMRERYPDGLTTTVTPLTKTTLPSDSSRIEFALPKTPSDPSQGWIPLHAGTQDTPVGKGLKDNGIVAFAIRPDDAEEDEELAFEVDFPSFDDDYPEEEAEAEQ